MVKEVKRINREEGLKSLIYKSTAFTYRELIRPILPSKGYIHHNGARVNKRKKWFDSLLPRDPLWYGSDPYGITDQPLREEGLISAHRDFTQEGDHVVIIGGVMVAQL